MNQYDVCSSYGFTRRLTVLWFIFGGGREIRTLVLLATTVNDYTFIRLIHNRQINGSYFDIVTNNCVEFTFNRVAFWTRLFNTLVVVLHRKDFCC